MSDELSNLAGLTAQIDGEVLTATAPPPDPNAPQPAPEPSQADQIAGILIAVGQAGALRFPSLGKVYTEEACKAHGAAMAPALERLGFTLKAGETMVYLGAAGSLIMLLYQTRTAVLEDIKAERGVAAVEVAPTPTPATKEAAGAPAQTVHPQTALYD
jgi:hypothetical protein